MTQVEGRSAWAHLLYFLKSPKSWKMEGKEETILQNPLSCAVLHLASSWESSLTRWSTQVGFRWSTNSIGAPAQPRVKSERVRCLTSSPMMCRPFIKKFSFHEGVHDLTESFQDSLERAGTSHYRWLRLSLRFSVEIDTLPWFKKYTHRLFPRGSLCLDVQRLINIDWSEPPSQIFIPRPHHHFWTSIIQDQSICELCSQSTFQMHFEFPEYSWWVVSHFKLELISNTNKVSKKQELLNIKNFYIELHPKYNLVQLIFAG